MRNSKILLDTNIIIHRETERIVNSEIGKLFNWLDKIKAEKYIHPITLQEINRLQNEERKQTFKIKLGAYNHLIAAKKLELKVKEISDKYDKGENDKNDTFLINEVYRGTVDILITEDRKIHEKAKLLNISEKIFTIESFLERIVIEFPEFKEYKVLNVRKTYIGTIDLSDKFFNSLKEDYPEFERWLKRKINEPVYISTIDGKNLCAFLYLKIEYDDEDYSDIIPTFSKKAKRLKIGTFKITLNGCRLAERFLKIIFDNAIKQKVDEIYVTIFNKSDEQRRLINLFEEWGFNEWGYKKSTDELVYVRDFSQKFDIANPKKTYPYISLKEEEDNKIFIIPIWPDYHTELLPDSILRTESPIDFSEDKPHRNAISKVYISRSFNREIKKGDLILFYRTGEKDKLAKYSALITTIGIADEIINNIKDEKEFVLKAMKRSIFNINELKEWWNYNRYNRPFLINFLHVYSLTPKQRSELIRNELLKIRILTGEENELRGLKEISKDAFKTIIKKANINESYFIY